MGIQAPKNKHKFFVPKYEPIQLKEREYKIEPYIFGLYCGDGNIKSSRITCDLQDMDTELKILNQKNQNEWKFRQVFREDKNWGLIYIDHDKDITNKRIGCKLFVSI